MQQQNEVKLIIEENVFEHYAQPIFYLNSGYQIGGELLLRAQYGTPEFIFYEAKKLNRLYELDTLSIMKAIQSISPDENRLLFLNVFPSTVKNPLFPAFIDNLLSSNDLKCDQIVFELNESEGVGNIDFLKKRIDWLRNLGFLIALDDLGNGSMTLVDMMKLDVDLIKLDRYFSQDLHKSTKKQNLISAVLHFCRLGNIKVILEGIENEEVLQVAKSLGVEYGQGYHLGRPEKLTVYTR